MFASRWRWDLSRSLAILRFRGGKKNPLPIQRMEADDLMAAIFPALAACQENTPPGPVQLPDHVIVRQVLDDCLHEAMDVDGLSDAGHAPAFGRGQGPFRRLGRALRALPRDRQRPALHVPRRRPPGGEAVPPGTTAPGPARRGEGPVPPRRRRFGKGAGRGGAEPARPRRAPRPIAVHPGPSPREDWREWFQQLVGAGRAMELLVSATAGRRGRGRRPGPAVVRHRATPVGRGPVPGGALPARLPPRAGRSGRRPRPGRGPAGRRRRRCPRRSRATFS